MKCLRLLLMISLPFFAFSKSCRADIIIKYIIKKDPALHSTHSLSDYCLDLINNNYDNFDLDSKKKILSVKQVVFNGYDREIVIIKYKINRSGVYFLTDLFGHEIFLDQSLNDDTIVLKLEKYKYLKENLQGRKLLYLNDSIRSSVLYHISYPPQYKYIGFFDSLAYLHGDLRAGGSGISFKQLNHDIDAYLPKIHQVYADRIKFLREFIQKYTMPQKFQRYAFKEIQYCYYNDLLEPVLEWDAGLLNNYPVSLRDSIRNIGNDLNNKDLFDNISFYRTIIAEYSFLGNQSTKLRSMRDEPDSAFIISRLNFCKKKFFDECQGYSLASLLFIASHMNSTATFIKIYQNYDHKNGNVGINAYVDSLYSIIINNGNLTAPELLNLSLEDGAHNSHKLGELFNKNVILIDCWATWCIPCRKQTPALDSIASEYKDRVQFISLSADQFISKWDGWLSKIRDANKCTLQLHAPNGFENSFFKKLMINAIPRYILISRSGKILNVAMPFPDQKEEFKKELQKYL